MQTAIDFKYGKQICSMRLPLTAVPLNIKEPRNTQSIDPDCFETDLSLNLTNNWSENSRISIVVADKTRLCQYPTFLPILFKAITQKKICPSNITFFIAYGTHKRQSDAQCLKVYGELYKTCKFIHHDGNDKTLFKRMGKTNRGTPVHIRKDLLSSDLIITFGALSHHYFAGYGGGRKLIFPGLGFKQDIYKNHALFLDKANKQLHPGCQPGNLKDNPLANDLKDIDDFIKVPRLNIHGILNSTGQVFELIIGKDYDDFAAACKRLDTFYRIPGLKQYNTVIGSCGGFPKDINLIQAHKAINNAAMFVKDGGNLIILAQCIDGVGSDTLLPYFETSDSKNMDFKTAFSLLENAYKGNGGTALSMMSKTARINIFLKTDLDDKICAAVGVKKLDRQMMDTLLSELTNKLTSKLTKKDRQDMAYIENASLLTR